ncbi:ABC transporter substrate-binding protein [Streptomyces sp. NPDC058045]|uniref:ABC transporter substrate-binding protein n=1 Tax=Streptomyces sp. NPDC058045 TaxID=3346311 RepID=UPI0036E325E0
MRGATLLAALAIAVAGCSEAGTESDGGNSSGGKDGSGTITYQLYLQASAFSPFTALTGGDGLVSLLQFQPLLAEAKGAYTPRVAEKWEVNTDATKYTFHLRKASWSDGKPITSKDVAFSLEATADPKTAAVWAGAMLPIKGTKEFQAGKAKNISGIATPDDQTVEITLAKPHSGFLANLVQVGIVPEHVYGGIGHDKFKGNEAFHTPKVGSGPYVFSKWINDDTIEFAANKRFWGKVPAAKLVTKFLAGDAALAQLQTGEVDIAQIPAAEVEPLKGDKKVTVAQAPGSGVMTLHTALKNGKLKDKRVRQAILHAINRESIVKKVLSGQARVADTALFAPDWAQPTDLVRYDYDPAKAKRLLAEAGWKAGTELRLDITPGQADRDAVMKIVQGQLRAVGVKAKITPLQPAQVADVVKNNEFDLMITVLNQVPQIEPSAINVRLNCDQVAPAGVNITGYCDKKLDALLDQGMATTDRAKRQQAYQAANRIINKEVPILPLYVPMANYGVTKRISGFDASVSPALTLITAEQWKIRN